MIDETISAIQKRSDPSPNPNLGAADPIAADHMLALLLPDAFDSYHARTREPRLHRSYPRRTRAQRWRPLRHGTRSLGSAFLGPGRQRHGVRTHQWPGQRSHQKGGRAHHTRPPPAPRRAQRLITLADLIFDDDPNSADTRTWFDHMTPLLITSGGGGMELLSQFFALTPPRCCHHAGRSHLR